MPAPWPAPRPQWFSPLTEALRPSPSRPPAAACLPSGSHAAGKTVTQRPGTPGGPVDLPPGPVQAHADSAVTPNCHHGLDQQNLYLLSHPYLFPSLAWAGAPA